MKRDFDRVSTGSGSDLVVWIKSRIEIEPGRYRSLY